MPAVTKAFTFRPLSDADMALMHRWLNEPDIVRWWDGEDVSWEAVRSKYAERPADGYEDWVALACGEAVGWLGGWLGCRRAG